MKIPKYLRILLVTAIVVAIGIGGYFGYIHLSGKAIISSNIDDAKITLDGKSISKGSIWLKPGQHSAEANKEGYLLSTVVFTVKPLLKTDVNLHLSKLTSLSPGNDNTQDFKIDELARQRVESSGNANYFYLDEDQKAVYQFSDNKSVKVMDLSFLSTEGLDKYKWSPDRSQLFVRSFKNDNFYSRLITIYDKSTKDLGADTLDVAFGNKEYFSLKKSGSGVIVSGGSGQIAQISELKNILEYDGSNFYLYNKVGDDNSGDIYFCEGSKCQKFNVSGEVVDSFASNNHAVAITLDQKFSLYDISNGKSKLVDANVALLGTWSGNDFYYLKNGDACSIQKYDFAHTSSIYQNSNICDIDDFSISNNKLFFRQSLSAYELDLK